jgi:hypothetical protein
VTKRTEPIGYGLAARVKDALLDHPRLSELAKLLPGTIIALGERPTQRELAAVLRVRPSAIREATNELVDEQILILAKAKRRAYSHEKWRCGKTTYTIAPHADPRIEGHGGSWTPVPLDIDCLQSPRHRVTFAIILRDIRILGAHQRPNAVLAQDVSPQTTAEGIEQMKVRWQKAKLLIRLRHRTKNRPAVFAALAIPSDDYAPDLERFDANPRSETQFTAGGYDVTTSKPSTNQAPALLASSSSPDTGTPFTRHKDPIKA